MNLPWLKPLKSDLNSRIEAGRLGHAPLIQGSAGLGKLELARWLVARILCHEPIDDSACGQCPSCQLLAAATHPDCFELNVPEDRHVIPVDLIRELIERMHLTSSLAHGRVGLIVAADAMNRNAANALLKTLEEPSAGAWLVLVSDHPASLPATVRSRCQRFVVRPPPPPDALAWLDEACPSEDRSRRAAALALAGGAPLTARAMLEDGELDRGLQVLEVLIDPVRRAGGDVLEQWQHDAPSTWAWLSRWVGMLMGRSQHAEALDPDLAAHLPPLPDGLPPGELGHFWERALEGRRLAEAGSVRQDLLIGKWLLEWETLISRSPG